MDVGRPVKKVEVIFKPQKKFKLKKFVNFFIKKNQVQRQQFLNKKITPSQIDLAVEIVINFLKGRLSPDYRTLQFLNRCKAFMRELVSKSTSHKVKKKLLQTVKGLHVLNLVIPLLIAALK